MILKYLGRKYHTSSILSKSKLEVPCHLCHSSMLSEWLVAHVCSPCYLELGGSGQFQKFSSRPNYICVVSLPYTNEINRQKLRIALKSLLNPLASCAHACMHVASVLTFLPDVHTCALSDFRNHWILLWRCTHPVHPLVLCKLAPFHSSHFSLNAASF